MCTGNENSKPIWNKFIIRKDIIETSQVVLNFCRTVYVVMTVTISASKRCSVRLYRQLFVGGCMSYILFICLRIVVSNTCFVLGFFLRFVYPMLPVSLDCPVFIAPSVLSNVYSSISRLKIIHSYTVPPFIYIIYCL